MRFLIHSFKKRDFNRVKVIVIVVCSVFVVVLWILHRSLLIDSRQSALDALSFVLQNESAFEARVFGDDEALSSFRRCAIGDIRYVDQQILGYPVIFECNSSDKSEKVWIIVNSETGIQIRMVPAFR